MKTWTVRVVWLNARSSHPCGVEVNCEVEVSDLTYDEAQDYVARWTPPY